MSPAKTSDFTTNCYIFNLIFYSGPFKAVTEAFKQSKSMSITMKNLSAKPKSGKAKTYANLFIFHRKYFDQSHQSHQSHHTPVKEFKPVKPITPVISLESVKLV